MKALIATFILIAVALAGTSYLYAQDAQNNSPDAQTDSDNRSSSNQDRRDMMMDGCRMMMSARLETTSPQGTLAMKDELDLSEDQAEQLRQIAAEARERSQDVLNADQRDRLAELEDQPATMMQMMQRCRDRMRDHADQNSMMMQCPMNMMMQSAPATQPSDGDTTGTSPRRSAMSCC